MRKNTKIIGQVLIIASFLAIAVFYLFDNPPVIADTVIADTANAETGNTILSTEPVAVFNNQYNNYDLPVNENGVGRLEIDTTGQTQDYSLITSTTKPGFFYHQDKLFLVWEKGGILHYSYFNPEDGKWTKVTSDSKLKTPYINDQTPNTIYSGWGVTGFNNADGNICLFVKKQSQGQDPGANKGGVGYTCHNGNIVNNTPEFNAVAYWTDADKKNVDGLPSAGKFTNDEIVVAFTHYSNNSNGIDYYYLRYAECKNFPSDCAKQTWGNQKVRFPSVTTFGSSEGADYKPYLSFLNESEYDTIMSLSWTKLPNNKGIMKDLKKSNESTFRTSDPVSSFYFGDKMYVAYKNNGNNYNISLVRASLNDARSQNDSWTFCSLKEDEYGYDLAQTRGWNGPVLFQHNDKLYILYTEYRAIKVTDEKEQNDIVSYIRVDDRTCN